MRNDSFFRSQLLVFPGSSISYAAWFSRHSPTVSPPRLRERPLASRVDRVGHLRTILRISTPPSTVRASSGIQQENGGPQRQPELK
jgi:hypothetical protein